MGGTTPKYQLPYPTGTDRVADGDNAMQALAERVEAAMVGGPWMMKIGSGAIAFDAQGYGNIVFPTPFPSTFAWGYIDLIDALENIGALMFRRVPVYTDRTSMSWRAFTPNGANFSGALTITWIALGT